MTDLDIVDGGYLQSYLRCLRPWLDNPAVTEILVNRPGEVWFECVGKAGMSCEIQPAIDDLLIERLASQIARMTHQGVNRQSPLLSASLPSGERVQIVCPPVTRKHWALAIRRYVAKDANISDFHYAPRNAQTHLLCKFDEARETPAAFLKSAVIDRKTILVSGGTSSGKTTLLNALMRHVPKAERIVTVEDTPEVEIAQPNWLSLVAAKSMLGEASIGVDDLLEAALRLRPDRIIVGEVRGREAATFLRAVNTGHPGSVTTIHANSPSGAFEQLALMMLQTGMRLTRADTIEYCKSVVDIVVQLGKVEGKRSIIEIWTRDL